MRYEELFAASVDEARRKDIQIWNEAPPLNRTLNGVHYLDWGGDGLPPMVLVHGALVTAHVWDFFSLEMRERFHIYAVDLPGHGDSAWATEADYTRSRMASDVVSLIEQLELNQLVLIGHSLGGSVAALVAEQLPSRIPSLVLVDSTLLPNPQPPGGGFAALLNGPTVFPSLEAFAKYAASLNPRRRPEQLMLSLQWNARQLEDGSWTWKYDPAVRGRRPPDFDRVWTALQTVSCPTLFVRAGENSHATAATVERLQTLPHVKIVVVPDAAHNVMGDNPLVFSHEIRDFLTQGGGR